MGAQHCQLDRRQVLCLVDDEMIELLDLLGLLATGVAHPGGAIDQQARVGQRAEIVEIKLL